MKDAPYILINGFLNNLGPDEILIRCSLEHEWQSIIGEAHSDPAGGHYQVDTTTRKMLQSGL